ncbi:MAG TPA: N-6 DNA methylase, partial [Chloroflexia bacterium]|nr:N-6 DNA methylase [Chloroflexia bacterium]
ADAKAFWETLQRRLRRLKEEDPATSDTREYWIGPLLESLGYKLTFISKAAEVNGQTYAISHRAAEDESGPPVHIEGLRRSLDQRPPSGRPRLSPHALMQEYLNATEHLWGIVTNGEKLRLLRDSSRTTRPTYVEFDLRAMLEGEKFSEFALFYRLLHRTRLPVGMDDAPKCLLEQYHQQALEAGGRVREGLRVGVETALRELGNGLLLHPANKALRQTFATGKSANGNQFDTLGFYRQLLRLVYRLLFLMVAEERGLISGSEQGQKLYRDFYSVSRLRRLAEQPGAGRGQHSDLWLGLLTTFHLLEDDHGAKALGITALDGDLFGPQAIPELENTQLYNQAFLRAIRALSLYRDQGSKALRRVNYSALDVEELGSVYESLLDYRPVVLQEDHNGQPFDLVTGTERKTTGSYYTRPELVHELIVSSLEPVLHDRLAAVGTDKTAHEEAILSITVCDPACGSGHFLLAAARRLGRELARVRSGEDQPNPEQFRRAVRDVIARCIYGVDVNPLAVDLCKLALWLEGHNAGMPLSFLDSHIRWGNSLIGARRDLVEAGIPDEAYQAVTGDDKKVAAAFKKRNKEEREKQQHGQMAFAFDSGQSQQLEKLVRAARQLDSAPDTSVEAVRAKAAAYAALREQEYNERTLFNLWTAAFFLPLTGATDPTIPTSRSISQFKTAPKTVHGQMVGRVNGLATEMGFFHWELEFPQVFDKGGFDVVLGNPPWERIKLQEEEHWVDDPYISKAANKAERAKRITEYRISADPLKRQRIQKFDDAKYRAEAESRFIRASNRYPLTAVGDVNTYALFAEHDRNLVNPKGRAGVIVPTGIATDDTCKKFFSNLNEKKRLVSLYDFENREKLFPEVDSRMKFSLLTMGDTRNQPTQFTFFATNVNHLKDEFRSFTLSAEEIALLNPNTRTCPVFRTSADAELTKKIYLRVPVLVNERTGENFWGTSFMTMLHMANDSHLFKNNPGKNLVPLYEAKLIHQFTNRWASYSGETSFELSLEQLEDPTRTVIPRYWIEYVEVQRVLSKRWDKQWLFGFRDITNATNERTAIFSLLPKAGVGHTLPLIFLKNIENPLLITAFLACMNCLTFDYVARQKIGGTHLTFGLLNQLPVLLPSAFHPSDVEFISERVLELVYSAWDMQPFAQDVWAELDLAGRERVLKRWQENQLAHYGDSAATRIEIQNSVSQCLRGEKPLPPFIWNEERRAHIRAELDARVARLYGLTRDELRYILDPADIYGPDFPGETFRVLKEKEIKQYGEYRTRRLVLEKWDAEEIDTTEARRRGDLIEL